MFRITILIILMTTSHLTQSNEVLTNIDQAMYFKSYTADAEECKDALTVQHQKIKFKNISNPALTCPNAFAWQQFMEAVDSKFWSKWATDQQIWVKEPKALCENEQSIDCCALEISTGKVSYRGASNKNDYNCPFYPASKGGVKLTRYLDKQALSFHSKKAAIALDNDISRVARDTEAEIVYHNKSFFNYTVSNNLFHTNGLAKVFEKKKFEAENQAPYRPSGQGVNYPNDAVMFKVDFLSEEVMIALGYINEHDNNNAAEFPYITMNILNPVTKKKNVHYLVAVTGASKALPNWHWYAFEHVNNIGRCDYLGCNDSYGFRKSVTINMPNGLENKFDSHYIPPHQKTTDLGDNLFDRNKRYESADMTPQLHTLFRKMKIGQNRSSTYTDKPKNMPTKQDLAWKSYRLKGTQTNYYHNDGTPVMMGASITEGGFVNSSSCMSCHAQASVNSQGAADSGPVGDTMNLSLNGINQVTNGAPIRGIFYQPGSTKVNAATVDFVWGILGANPLSEK